MISNKHHENEIAYLQSCINEWKDRYLKKDERYDHVCNELRAANVRCQELETRSMMLEGILNEFIHPEKEDTKYIFYRGRCYKVRSMSLDIDPETPEELNIFAISIHHIERRKFL